jgi:hypothetical protein
MSSMTRRLLIYLGIAAAIAVAGYAVMSAMSEDEVPASDRRSTDARVDAPATSTKPAPIVGAPPTAAASGVKVVEVVGAVSRSGATGERSAVTPGTELAVDDTLVTETDSRVRIKVGERSTVDLSQNAEVQVRELSESIQRLGLVYGRAAVDYKEDGDRVLRIENQDGSAVAQVKAGKFSILNTGTTVAVATETGQVDLSAAGSTVVIGADQQSVVAGGAPLRPLAIPAELVLRVVDPGCRVQRETFFNVTGKTSPGSRVTVNQKVAHVRDNGDFSLRVPLKIGKNQIVVLTEDVSGRSERRVIPCVTVDPGAPIQGVDIKWGGGGG